MKRDRISTAISLICAAITAATFVHLLLSWVTMPDIIPTHYGADGTIDAWGGKARAFFPPIVMLLMLILFEWVERHPKIWNTGVRVTDENRVRVYGCLRALVISLKLIIIVAFAVISATQVSGTPLPWHFLPTFLLVTFGDLALWLVPLRRFK
ncbi:DUF1648 domain-containing protein [Curtanaerobium respiraculi]|uniref:DUF1648 domain-containing protein n=1 Tax=Curtanaerobium respiraculi TaxID=2949669 RepID=UPI0024B339A7|nr:DUF1648 domain-containing protein [Curtanaerobium respiraculi]